MLHRRNVIQLRQQSRLKAWLTQLSWVTIGVGLVVTVGLWAMGEIRVPWTSAPFRVAHGGQPIEGVASVIDGDTLVIHGIRIRLHGIDAPEGAQTCRKSDGTEWRCGQQAALALQNHIGRQVVSCAKQDMDRYGRVVAQCSVRGADINAWLVANGWAVAYRQYSSDYAGDERVAKAAGLGVWAGSFVMPWDYRNNKRADAAPKKSTVMATAGCDIKGNISRTGARIYHVPDGYFYGRTGIDTSKGERWFCSENEARKAGWYRSKR